MRILFACTFKFQMAYGIMHKLVHGLIREGHQVMTFDDRRVARAATWFNSRKFGIGAANRQLIEAAAAYQPGLLILGHCEMILNATLEAIRRAVPGVRIIYRNDDPLMHAANVRDIHNRTAHVDWIFSTTAGEALRQFAGRRARIAHVPNPVDAVLDPGQAFARTDQPHDVFYGIGGVYAGDPRPGFIQQLRASCPDVRFDVHGMEGKVSLFGQHYLNTLMQAKMGLNYSRENNVYLYSSDRMAQYMGNGLLTFIDRASGFGELFAEDAAGFYSSAAELGEKIRHYAADEAARQKTAQAGWARIHDIFAAHKVGQYMVDCAFTQPFRYAYAWPTAVY